MKSDLQQKLFSQKQIELFGKKTKQQIDIKPISKVSNYTFLKSYCSHTDKFITIF
jgi:hypothetical protein